MTAKVLHLYNSLICDNLDKMSLEMHKGDKRKIVSMVSLAMKIEFTNHVGMRSNFNISMVRISFAFSKTY